MTEQINKAVEVICQDIQENSMHIIWSERSEEDILFELILSILGSQNKYEVALAFANAIRDKNILSGRFDFTNIELLERKLVQVFLTPQKVGNSLVKYRFPKTRATFIAYNLCFIQTHKGIKHMLKLSNCTSDMRRFLVKSLKGLGPKQSSHFLRNIGYSNAIAVLDVHILRYMHIQGVIQEQYKSISNLKLYEELESLLIDFLKFIMAPIGFIDQAIWVVMRVYQKEHAKWQ